ncbi:hypothetical protein CWB66_04640 [Pseudoalteromonas sp. S558]|nr:hypothetical protein CWB66_04640 [Pseudoalteromonas sp. S558]
MNRKKKNLNWAITAAKRIEQVKILLDSLTQLSKSINSLILTLCPYTVVLTLTQKGTLYTLIG